jgi:myo-inositol 2-dehydrogenase/D-chiro-inositol 1-dehydrogenase
MIPADLSRRTFLGRSCAAAGSLAAAGAPAAPAGGFFAGGGDALRIGLIGCGGRGTGAAAQALAADPGARIAALADLFPDRIESAVEVLGRQGGPAGICPAERRFAGADAWLRLLEADLDAVILATAPDARPAQATAAVAAGRHVFCEAPAAIDAAGVATVLAACATAAARGLAFGSGLAWRHDPATARKIGLIQAGAIGRPVSAVFTARIGPAWRTSDTGACRNWISCPARSGGDLVEHQVHAIDKALWAWGDEPPAWAEPAGEPGAGLAVRYVFADGRRFEAGIARRPGGRDRLVELVRGDRGACDLREAGVGRHARGMAAFVASIRAGETLDEGRGLCRSTLAAVLGREAAEAATPVPWPTWAPAAPPRQRAAASA